jgi:hypothetical protein
VNELPHPPADYTKLADFPVLPKDLVPAEVYRVHQSVYGPEYFSYKSKYRWDPTPGMGDEFGSCYTSPQEDIAFAEAMGEFVVIPQGEIDKRSISLFELSDELRSADMTSDKLVGKYQLDVRIATGEDYPLCQEWATALRQAGFDGIYYQARHGMSWGTSIAFFGEPGHHPEAVNCVGTSPISDAMVDELVAQYGYGILPSTPL